MTIVGLQTLPYEVLASIFDILDPKSLDSACLISRVCNEAATPALYKSTSWSLSKQGASWDLKSPLWSAFRRLPWLRNHVKSLAICLDAGTSFSNSSGPTAGPGWRNHYDRVVSRLIEEIDQLPSIRHLELRERHWKHIPEFKIKIGLFCQLVHTLGARVQEITLPSLDYHTFEFFKGSSYPRSLTFRGLVGSFLRSSDSKAWARHVKRLTFGHLPELSGLNGILISLCCLRVEMCGAVEPILDAIASSRGLESLDMTVSESDLDIWVGSNQKDMDFPALKYIRVRIKSSPGNRPTVGNARRLFKCITSASNALLSVSIDVHLPRRNCSASEGFAVWIASRHGRTIESLYFGYLKLGEECIHHVLFRCPRLKAIGFTHQWRQPDLLEVFASLRFAPSLKAMCLTTTRTYSDQQVYSTLVQNFPHISYFFLRADHKYPIKYALWKGEWCTGFDSETVVRTVKRVECCERDWENFISREQCEFVDSLEL